MIPFFLRRLALFIPTMFLMSIVAFAIILAPPGDFLTDYVAQLQSQGTVVKLRARSSNRPSSTPWNADMGWISRYTYSI